MITIIKEGKVPKTPTYEHTCQKCDTVFTYNNHDTEKISPPEWARYARGFDVVTVRCPLCLEKITVGTKIRVI